VAANVNCPFCGKLTDPKLANCPHCGGPITPGALSGKSAPPGDSASLLPRHCPNCHTSVQDGDIICTKCGTNLLTGQRITKDQDSFIDVDSNNRKVLIKYLAAGGLVVLLALVVLFFTVFRVNPVREATSLAEAGKVLEAINVLQQYLDNNPADPQGQFLMGQLSLRSQQYTGAVQAFEAASRLEPENADAGLLAVYAANMQPQASSINAQITNLRHVVEHHPDFTEAWYLLALLQGISGNYPEQIQSFERVLELAPQNQSMLRFVGIAKALQGDIREAQADLERSLRVDANNADAAAAMGIIMQTLGNTEQAREHLENALEYGTSILSQTQTRLALLYIAQGHYEEALPLLRMARTDDDAPIADFYHAMCLQAIGLEVEALQEYERIKDVSNHPMAGEAALQMAILLSARNDVTRAQESLRQATQLGAETSRTQTVQGRIHMLNGELTEAQQAFRRAIQLNPEYAAAHLESGLLYVNRGVLSEGIRALERYLSLVSSTAQNARTAEIELLVNQLKQAQQGT